MGMIWTSSSIYRRVSYSTEADLETAILRVQHDLFGPSRLYLDVKKKIGSQGGIRNIPDGYLIDLTGRVPRLYVVENELASHEHLRHIAVQILEFSLSFESEPRAVKSILYNALSAQADAKARCEEYAVEHGLRNLDNMLDWLVFESPFAALVIIDEMPDDLENVLARKFNFGVEVLELARYDNANGEQFYQFEPFLADVSTDLSSAGATSVSPIRPLDTAEIDTVVVPAREEGFQAVFLGENRWHEIKIHGSMRPQIKYIAVYRVRPISAVTPYQLQPSEFRTITKYGLGFTDLVGDQSGSDSQIDFSHFDVEPFITKIVTVAPRVLAFNGITAAKKFYAKARKRFHFVPTEYGRQAIGIELPTQIEKIAGFNEIAVFMLPSTSLAAQWCWDESFWFELADFVSR